MTSRPGMYPELDIRPARPEEYTEIGELSYAAYADRYTTVTEEYGARLLHPESRSDETDIWVAVERDSGRIVGTNSIRKELYNGELMFEVLASAAGSGHRGIGTLLLEHFFAVARSRGITRAGLYSGSTMTAAHSFYAKHGFERVFGEELSFLEDGEPITVYKFTREIPPL